MSNEKTAEKALQDADREVETARRSFDAAARAWRTLRGEAQLAGAAYSAAERARAGA